MEKYKHFISLGYFCSPAIELERIGLRSCSSPFDWIISDWKGIEKAISTNFEGFLEYDNLLQDKQYHSHYKDEKYNFEFYHDFSKYVSLEKQLVTVKEKYNRRISRFFSNIKEPTLFIRYISSENGDDELKYIEKNYDNILKILRQYNQSNDICFIADTTLYSDKIKIYYVERDEKDNVARRPFDKNKELYNLFNSFDFLEKEKNLLVYEKKQAKEKSFFYRCKRKIINNFKKIFYKEYIHCKQYEKLDGGENDTNNKK